MWDIDECEVVKWPDQNLMWQGAEWCVSMKWSTYILSSYQPPWANGQCALLCFSKHSHTALIEPIYWVELVYEPT